MATTETPEERRGRAEEVTKLVEANLQAGLGIEPDPSPGESGRGQTATATVAENLSFASEATLSLDETAEFECRVGMHGDHSIRAWRLRRRPFHRRRHGDPRSLAVDGHGMISKPRDPIAREADFFAATEAYS